MRSRRLAFAALVLTSLMLVTPVRATEPPPSGQAGEANAIIAIRAVPDGIEIEVRSDRPFPARALPAVLVIGEREFHGSRYPRDGRKNTLIFLLSREEFAGVSSGDLVTVKYGRGRAASPRALWGFGPLDKSMLGDPRSGS